VARRNAVFFGNRRVLLVLVLVLLIPSAEENCLVELKGLHPRGLVLIGMPPEHFGIKAGRWEIHLCARRAGIAKGLWDLEEFESLRTWRTPYLTPVPIPMRLALPVRFLPSRYLERRFGRIIVLSFYQI